MKYIAYYRVSTKQQGASGLGIEGQKAAVKKFTNNCQDCILQEFTEIESGKNNERKELKKAIEAAKNQNATLLIAKLDRLSRNASFIFQLRDTGVTFVCCDNPQATELTINLLAIIAEDERKRISERTKAALQARKEKFGEWRKSNFNTEARQKAIAANIQKAKENENNKRAIQLIIAHAESGKSLRQIATILNENEYRTSTGKMFQATTVKRLYDRHLKQLKIA